MTEEKKNHKQAGYQVKTFPVPFDLREIKENITINTNSPSKLSKEQIINQAFKFHSQGNISEAKKLYQYFINQGFTDHRVFTNYGVMCRDLGRLQEAELSYRKAIEIKPDFADAYYNLGSLLKDLGQLQEAEFSTRKAIELNPFSAIAHYNLGIILKDLGQLQEAEFSYRKAIEIKPDFASAHSNLGIILKDIGQLQEAELSYRKAIEINPEFLEAHLNLGYVLRDLGKLQEAELSYRKAIEIKPDFAEAHSNLGYVLRDLGQLQEAEFSYRKAIEIKPDFADAYFNLSLIELLKGDYESGLKHYELREKRKKGLSIQIKPNIQKIDCWNFEKGEKLLIVSEQGLGDTLQFMRYIPILKKQGLEISFCAQTKLHSIIKASGIEQNPLTPEEVNKVSEGKWMPLLSLPRYLKVTPGNPIVTQPYIHSTEKLVNKWKDILSKERKPIVGINWQGNPKMEKVKQKGRSIPLEKFSIIADNNEITMLSLQRGFGSEQLDHCLFKNKFVQCQQQIDSIWDFLENAAIIENCDLIITSDTSIAHLAGGMGKKVWVLLKDIPFWTWGLESENTFWYPSMRLFRQKERHNWQEVMERVSSKLKKEIEVKT